MRPETRPEMRDGAEEVEQPLNPRIVKGLNSLYDGILNEPLPDKITSILDELRAKERSQNDQPSHKSDDDTGGSNGDD